MRDEHGALREVRIHRQVRCDELQTIADIRLAGAGIARLPLWLAEPHLRAGDFALLPNTREVEI